MALTYVFSAVLFGALLVAVTAALSRGVEWRQATVSGTVVGNASATRRTDPESVPIAWVVGFVLLALGAGASVLLVVGESTAPVGGDWLVVGALLGGLLGGYLLWGVYQAARFRGLKSAQAIGASLWTAGLLGLGAIVLQLLG